MNISAEGTHVEYDGEEAILKQAEEAIYAHWLDGTGSWQVHNGEDNQDVTMLVDPVAKLIGLQATNVIDMRMKDRSSWAQMTPGNVNLGCDMHTVHAGSQIELKVGESTSLKLTNDTIHLKAGAGEIIISPSGIILVGDVTAMGSAFNVIAGRVNRGGSPTWDT